MSTLYRVDSSIQGEHSVTHEIADELQRAFTAARPDAEVVRRDLLATPLSPAVWTQAMAARSVPAPTAEQQAATALAGVLAGEMLASDAVVIGAPLYNWGPSAHLKCWIDMLWTDPRFAPRTYPLAGRPVVLVSSRGGDREDWDTSVPYLQRTFGPDVFGGEVTLIQTPLTLAEHSPHMAQHREHAAQLRSRSHQHARRTGTALAQLAP